MEIPGDSAHSASPFIEFQSGHHPHVRIKSIQNHFPRAPSIAHMHLFLLICYIFTKFPVIWLEMNKAGLNAYIFFNH